MRKLALALLFAASSAGAQWETTGLDADITKGMRDWRVPGLSIAIVYRGADAYVKGFGVRELGKPDVVTAHTKFGNMSTTKAFTSMLVAMLADSGKVAWDDPVRKLVPELEMYDPWVTRELTVRDLLTHRVGFGDPSYLWSDETTDFATIVRRLRLVPPQTSMRTEFAYNNVTYATGGLVASRAAGGTTWQELIQRRIYAPLGMTESYPDGHSLLANGGADVTSPHGIVNDTVRVLPVAVTDVDPIAPAGAMFSSAADMAKWLRFLLDSGRVNGTRLVSARNFAEMFAPQIIVPVGEFYPTARLTHPNFKAYGMGWFLEDYRGRVVAFHTGSIEGRSAIVGLIPEERLGVAIFTNLDHSELRHALMYTVFDRYLGAGVKPRDWSAEMLPMYRAIDDSAAMRRKAREAMRVTGTYPTLALPRYAGNYADSLFGDARITNEKGKLVLRALGNTGDLEHWQYDTYRVTWRDPFRGSSYVSFVLNDAGGVGELRMNGARWSRVP